MTKCNVCGHPIEDRGYKHAQCRFCGQVSNLCCDPEMECTAASEAASDSLPLGSELTVCRESVAP